MEEYPRTGDEKDITILDSDFAVIIIDYGRGEVRSKSEVRIRTIQCCVTKVMKF